MTILCPRPTGRAARAVVAVPSCPRAGPCGVGPELIPRPWGWRGPGLCRMPRRAAPSARLRLVAARHSRDTVGTGVALLRVLRGPLFIFFRTFFSLFLPSGPVRCPHLCRCLSQTLSSHGFIASPRDMPSRVQARIAQGFSPPPGKVPSGYKGTPRGPWGKRTRGHPDASPKSGEGVSDLEVPVVQSRPFGFCVLCLGYFKVYPAAVESRVGSG